MDGGDVGLEPLGPSPDNAGDVRWFVLREGEVVAAAEVNIVTRMMDCQNRV